MKFTNPNIDGSLRGDLNARERHESEREKFMEETEKAFYESLERRRVDIKEHHDIVMSVWENRTECIDYDSTPEWNGDYIAELVEDKFY